MDNQIVPSEGVPAIRTEAISVETLISQAIDKSLPVETMERFLAMRTQLKAEFAREEYYRAMSEFQAECPVIKKGKSVLNKDGKSVRYVYAPLDSIVEQTAPIMGKHGLSHRIETVNDDKFITAICHASHKLGYSESSSFRVPIDFTSYMSAQQQYASALTYAKRYAFCDAFGILTGDEDNDAAPMEEEKKPSPPAPKTAAPTAPREPVKFTPKPPAAPVKPAISDNDAKKIKIMELMAKNGIEPSTKTKEGWEKAVKSNMGLDLIPENFDKIIEVLSKTIGGPPDDLPPTPPAPPSPPAPSDQSMDAKLERVFGPDANPGKEQDWKEAARSCVNSDDAAALIRAMESANEKKGTISMIRGILSTRGLIKE